MYVESLLHIPMRIREESLRMLEAKNAGWFALQIGIQSLVTVRILFLMR